MVEDMQETKPERLTEGKIEFLGYTGKISRELPVFYNPVMKHNRDISVLFLRALGKENMIVCDPLGGSGIRAVRFLKELPKEMISQLIVNDKDDHTVDVIKQNLEMNGLSEDSRVEIMHTEANRCMADARGYDYVDIDPFGSPNPFLDHAVRRLGRGGILAVTATDTGALCGTFPKPCGRKYWAKPLHNEFMHETGLRILIRKCQLIGMQYDRALTPVVSYMKDHYMRIFFVCQKSKQGCDEIFSQHGKLWYCRKCGKYGTEADEEEFVSDCCGVQTEVAGDMWLGDLFDSELVGNVFDQVGKDDVLSADKELVNFLSTLKAESAVSSRLYYHISALTKKLKVDNASFDIIFERIKEAGYKVSRSHFDLHGMKTDMPYDELIKIISK